MPEDNDKIIRDLLHKLVVLERRYAHDRRNSTTERRREVTQFVETHAKDMEITSDAD